jgi:hypothetical protein
VSFLRESSTVEEGLAMPAWKGCCGPAIMGAILNTWRTSENRRHLDHVEELQKTGAILNTWRIFQLTGAILNTWRNFQQAGAILNSRGTSENRRHAHTTWRNFQKAGLFEHVEELSENVLHSEQMQKLSGNRRHIQHFWRWFCSIGKAFF